MTKAFDYLFCGLISVVIPFENCKYLLTTKEAKQSTPISASSTAWGSSCEQTEPPESTKTRNRLAHLPCALVPPVCAVAGSGSTNG